MKKFQEKRPIFTVFTPTFNRAHTLHRVYDSLKSQTFTDFEWVVVDDGSTDGTYQLIKDWQQSSEFPIVYLQQPNYGKHIAFNRGVKKAKGSLFLPIDSDDAFLPNSLSIMWHWWQLIPDNERQQYTGIVTLCQFENGQVCGDVFAAHPLDTNALNLRYKYKKRGETWGFHRTEILKNTHFQKIFQCDLYLRILCGTRLQKNTRLGVLTSHLECSIKTRVIKLPKLTPRKKL